MSDSEEAAGSEAYAGCRVSRGAQDGRGLAVLRYALFGDGGYSE